MWQMEPKFSSHHYFSLDGFAHAELFEGTTYVWEALARLKAYLQKKTYKKIAPPSGVYFVNPDQIFIGDKTVIEPGAFIQGPVVIGEENTIRHGAYIRGHVVTGKGCLIGHGTEVKQAIFLDGAKAAHFNYVGDSILGRDVNLGAGVKLANFRLDGGEVMVTADGKKIKTGLKKLGAILGDGVQIGCNAVTSPGTLIGPESVCYPCLNIYGSLAPKTVYRGKR
jgi:NDP-sugar pyrophosphorylase family protein